MRNLGGVKLMLSNGSGARKAIASIAALMIFSVSVLWAAQAWVQNGPTTCHSNAGGSGAFTCAITGTTDGNTLHIGIAIRLNAGTDLTSVTATLGTPAQISKRIITSSGQVGAWLYCETMAGGGTETVTITPNGTVFFTNVMLQEFSGSTCTADGSSGNDYNGTSSTNPTCGTFTPGTGSDIVTAVVYDNETNNGLSAGSGLSTNALILNNGGSSRSAGIEFKTTTGSPASQSLNWTDGTSSSWACTQAALLSATPTSTAVKHRVIGQ